MSLSKETSGLRLSPIFDSRPNLPNIPTQQDTASGEPVTQIDTLTAALIFVGTRGKTLSKKGREIQGALINYVYLTRKVPTLPEGQRMSEETELAVWEEIHARCEVLGLDESRLDNYYYQFYKLSAQRQKQEFEIYYRALGLNGAQRRLLRRVSLTENNVHRESTPYIPF